MDNVTQALLDLLTQTYKEKELIDADRNRLHEELRDVMDRMVMNHMHSWLCTRTLEVAAQQDLPILQAKMIVQAEEWDDKLKEVSNIYGFEDVFGKTFMLKVSPGSLRLKPDHFASHNHSRGGRYQNFLYRLYRKLGGVIGNPDGYSTTVNRIIF